MALSVDSKTAYTTHRPQLQAVRFACVTPVKPMFGENDDRFDAASTSKETKASVEKELSAAQKLCERMIRWYQNNESIRKFKEKTGLFRCGYKLNGLSDWSCSQYTQEAIKRHGVVKGIWKGFWRIAFCNPLTFKVKALQKYFVEP